MRIELAWSMLEDGRISDGHEMKENRNEAKGEMDVEDTGIGRHVSSLRKHSSDDVRRLVKQLVRKWREIVDDRLRLNPQEEQASSTLTADGNSLQQKISRNQVPDIAYSPNTHKESSDSDKKNL
ncbi:hypothetical protein GH714_005507 [Hevea brasiliensis]|uniref:TFIIS N-terminal domain-containing protein n=1 Tax=Hevea brasiliensis TaxID=3981 RepID=A0A6A6MXX8_HEVBR|nr:hypothetical protein GH714_005507 [Hevea brasiliensis]